MSEVAIRAENLVKRYPLAQSPRRRLLYVFGLANVRERTAEKAALDHVSVTISRGEKVGIVGRNGSGKSTFLSLVSGVLQPTSGRLEVRGTVHPLLSLGASFNDEMTAAQNVSAYLAQCGFAGSVAKERAAEIADFAELGEYWDQPVKTYSSGMRMRLMFASATSIEPDLLLLDEVLTVGDAYFVSKSLDRMRQLCSGSGTTLLMVSHSIGMVAELCDRIIWLDQGRVRMDGAPDAVRRAYDVYIRAEEENRLKKIQMRAARKWIRADGAPPDRESGPKIDPRPVSAGKVPQGIAHAQLQTNNRQPPKRGLLISRLSFEADGREVGILALQGERGNPIQLSEGFEHGNWGELRHEAGEAVREFLPYGTPFHKLPFLIRDPDLVTQAMNGKLSAVLRYRSEYAEELDLIVQAGASEAQAVAALSISPSDSYRDMRATLVPLAVAQGAEAGKVAVGRFGTRRMEIVNVEFLDGEGRERLVYTVGTPFVARLSYRVNDPSFDEKPVIVMVFEKDGYLKTHRFYLDGQRFGPERPEGIIEVKAAPLLLTPGEYKISIAVHAEGHATRQTPRDYFAVSYTVYDMYFRCFSLTVFEPGRTTILNDLIFQHPAVWVVDGRSIRSDAVKD